MNTEVKPCPFCGSQPGPLADEIDGSLVCGTCGARGPQRKFEWMPGQDGIIGRWNIRVNDAEVKK